MQPHIWIPVICTIAMFVTANGGAMLYAAGRITQKLDDLAKSLERINQDTKDRLEKVEQAQHGFGERLNTLETKHQLIHERGEYDGAGH